ncbi:MAG: FAD-dependent monooxygenase, partial [Geminicoccaceae bacterium]|nr:FAD-dependent monooxygenase [Geminicoccaceae bacterium]
ITTPVEGVHVVDVASGASADYDPREVGDHPFAYGVLNHQLRTALAGLVQGEGGIEVVAPDRVIALHPAGATMVAELDSGGRRRARLVVGADGRSSSVRELANIRTERWSYGQTALTFAVRHDRPHGGLVREFLRPSGPLALLPVGPRLTSITWVDRPEVAQWLAAGDTQTLIGRLEDEIGDLLGTIRLEGQVASWPLEGHLAARPVAPRAALVGDAAHGLHPIHAQGFNLGVRDVQTLVRLIAAANAAGRDIGGSDLLLEYARRRRSDARTIVGLTDGLARLFSTDFAAARIVRGLGLTLLDSVAPLRALAMRRGMGLNG